jgi:hypothetical protein
VTLGSFAISLVAGGVMGYTGMTGGEIRHTEIRSGAQPAADESDSDSD